MATGRKYLLAFYDRFDTYVTPNFDLSMFNLAPSEHVVFTPVVIYGRLHLLIYSFIHVYHRHGYNIDEQETYLRVLLRVLAC